MDKRESRRVIRNIWKIDCSRVVFSFVLRNRQCEIERCRTRFSRLLQRLENMYDAARTPRSTSAIEELAKLWFTQRSITVDDPQCVTLRCVRDSRDIRQPCRFPNALRKSLAWEHSISSSRHAAQSWTSIQQLGKSTETHISLRSRTWSDAHFEY